MYDSGQGVEKDLAAAAKWFEAAARQKIPEAEYALAGCYADGDGVPQNMVEAYRWASLAAAHGHPEAVALKGLWKRS